MAVLFFADWRFQRYRFLCDFENFTHALYRHVHFFCDFLRLRVVTQLLQQLTGYTNDLVDGFYHVHRNTNGTCLICNGAGDCLTNPPGCIRRELKALGAVKLFYRLEQTQIAFLNQVEEQHAAADITLCNGNNQSQVCLRQTLLCIFAAANCLAQCLIFLLVNLLAVALAFVQLLDFFLGFHARLHLLRQLNFFVRRQQIDLTDLL